MSHPQSLHRGVVPSCPSFLYGIGSYRHPILILPVPRSASPVTFLALVVSSLTLFDTFRLVDDTIDPWIANEDHERAGDATCHLRNYAEPGSRRSFRMYQRSQPASEHGRGEKAPLETRGGERVGVD